MKDGNGWDSQGRTSTKETEASGYTLNMNALAMNRVQLLLLAFPIVLFCSDLVTLFSTGPTVNATISVPPPPHYEPATQPLHRPIDFSASQNNPLEGHVYGTIVEIKFCTSCSYKGNAMTMKKMLEASFPGINVILSNYPPSLPKRMLSKVVPVVAVQFGTIGIVMGGEHIFSSLGIPPPQWYHSLRANRFGTMSVTWLIGNFAQSFLQSTGAFEVYCNSDLVFSKLKEHRFPSKTELRQSIASTGCNQSYDKLLVKELQIKHMCIFGSTLVQKLSFDYRHMLRTQRHLVIY